MSDIITRIKDAERQVQNESIEAFKRVQKYRGGTRVKRYHTVDCMVSETVGHHSANVAILCTVISEQKPSATLLLAALTHDLSEQFTGDVPATAKWESPALKAALDAMEAKYDRGWAPTTLITGYEAKVLKQADMLDLCFKAEEEVRMGNWQFRPILARGIDWLRTNEPLPMVRLLLLEIQHGLN
jgi:5'-deoxynucleotidase YfbR-like HD superfamily hydrolase